MRNRGRSKKRIPTSPCHIRLDEVHLITTQSSTFSASVQLQQLSHSYRRTEVTTLYCHSFTFGFVSFNRFIHTRFFILPYHLYPFHIGFPRFNFIWVTVSLPHNHTEKTPLTSPRTMRLLDTKTRRLTEFQGIHPDYAILSHTWGEEEVSFQDMQDESKASTMKGYSKIKGACAEALKDEFKYIWIDTCCINKESSSELSEAINSMYAWYQNSQVCYAYLVDVPDEADPGCENSLFTKSRWFTRG